MRVVLPRTAGEVVPPAPTPAPVPQPVLKPTLPEVEHLSEPEVEVPDLPPTFFGEPVSGNFLWCLDRSSSMSIADNGSGPIEDENGNALNLPSRIQVVKAECIRVLRQLKADDRFAIVHFGDSVTSFRELVSGSDGNKMEAVTEVSALMAAGGTAAHDALKIVCEQFGTEIDKIFFLCDGSPNKGGTAAQILQDFPIWFKAKRDAGCQLVCIHIGGDSYAASFMQALAAENGGTLIHK